MKIIDRPTAPEAPVSSPVTRVSDEWQTRQAQETPDRPEAWSRHPLVKYGVPLVAIGVGVLGTALVLTNPAALAATGLLIAKAGLAGLLLSPASTPAEIGAAAAVTGVVAKVRDRIVGAK